MSEKPTDTKQAPGAELARGADAAAQEVARRIAAAEAVGNPLARRTALTPADKLVTVTIDGIEVSVPKGTMIIRAAEMIGHAIPRFCDHPLLDPIGACRQCLVEIADDGRGRPMPKPQASCTTSVMPGQVIRTQATSEVAAKAQHGINEFLLINHPLDCPICDKGGECPLQNQAMMVGSGDTRFHDVKRTYPKPIPISAEILLDRERCVLCSRCTRFSDQIAGDPFLALAERGAKEQVAIYAEQPFSSYFSGNVIQICPVGALTSSAYRFRARPFDLVSTVTTCEHCASGCELRVDHRRNTVMRRLAGDAPEVNEEWNCDKGRFAFVSGRGSDRITHPWVRENGTLRPASWPEAVDVAVRGLRAAEGRVGLLPGGRLTWEDAYGWSKFARLVLGTNNIDFRARPHSAEEADFLAHVVAGRTVAESVTYHDLERAGGVLLAGLEPEEESPIVFLRLRKAWRKRGLRVWTVAPYLTNGARKIGATLVPTVPGAEAEALAAAEGVDLGEQGIILVGERLATVPGALSAALDLAERTGSRLAWIPRRAGERAAIEAGCLPGLLPGGRPLADPAARVDVQAAWEVSGLPAEPGLDADAIIAAATTGELAALVVGGVEPADCADPEAVRQGLENAACVISIEQRRSEVTERADVVFPAGLFEERAGTLLDWESRERPVRPVVRPRLVVDDLRVLAALADGLGTDLGVREVDAARSEIDELGRWDGARAAAPRSPEVSVPRVDLSPTDTATADGVAVRLATWRTLLDAGRGQDGEADLARTAPAPVARVSAGTAEQLGAGPVTITGGRGAITLPLEVDPTMVDGVVWAPTNAPGRSVREHLGLLPGAPVRLTSAAQPPADPAPGDPASATGGLA